MRNSLRNFTAFALAAVAFALPAKADTLNNTFDAPFDYVANGIIGDTSWDGVYLRLGDVPGSVPAGDGNGLTVVANTSVFGGGFFGIQSQGTSWSGGDNDGFFIYKVVDGDFDLSVENLPFNLAGGPGFDNRGFHFAGLMLRAYNTNNSGAPFSTTSTNAVENSVRLWRFNEFGIDGQIRVSTNGANQELSFAGSNDETNSSRFFRITRAGNIFTFYVKTNSGDAWFQVTNGLAGGVLNREDWAGVRLQVGIAQASFSADSRDALFDNFQLSGPNVTFPTAPAGPSGLIATATNANGSLTFSWQKGNSADNSLVLIRETGPIQHSPVNGISYEANAAFRTAGTLLGGSQTYAVYNGSGSSVTVSNLGANNRSYLVAVYEYSGTGATTVYNTASPATNFFAGPGMITSAGLNVPQNDIPTGGATAIRLVAGFSTGEVSDQTSATAWVSDNPSVADVAAGVVSGLSEGSATITATFGSFVLTTNITVHAPALTDDFSATNNYIADGLLGSMYDGMYLNFGDVPGAVAGGDGRGGGLALDSQISNTNGLSLSSFQSTWQSAANDGPFLFKIVPGSRNLVSSDFQAVIEINTMNTLATSAVGIMARLYDPETGGALGGSENHVNYWKIQNGTTSVRRTQSGGNNTIVAAGPVAANTFLLVQRANSTNFYFFEKATAAAQWTFVTNVVLAAAANNAPMQVGIAQQTQSGVTGTAVVHSFVLDAAGVVSPTPPPPAASDFAMTLNPDLSMTLNWVAADNLGNPVQSIVVMRANAPVSAQPSLGQPITANSAFGTPGTGLGGGNYVVFTSAPAPGSTNNSVTVTGLSPGVTYHAAVYTFVGSGATATFNNVIPVTGASDELPAGFLTGIEAGLAGGIPQGGIGQIKVRAIYTGGVAVDVSDSASVTSGDTNVISVMNGVLTGITNGTAPIRSVFGGFTNVVNVAVRPPLFTDDFSVAQNYLLNGITGSGWDGMYDPHPGLNPVPASPYEPLTLSGATVADANISSNNVLTITSSGDGWENDLSGGFFLFKYVPGDFQTAVHIESFDALNYNQPGLLARGYASSNGVLGLPLGYAVPNSDGTNDLGEYWVSLTRFDEFGIGTYARQNIDSGVSQNTQPDAGDTNFWLLIVRSSGTNFNFYKRLAATDPWRRLPNNTAYQIAQLSGRPMQVGVMAGPWTGTGGVQRTVQFGSFMLDYSTGSTLHVSVSGGSVLLSWPPDPNLVLEASPSLSLPDWQPVSGAPQLDANGYSLTIPWTTDDRFFRLKR
jgi:hypothetical protein